MGEPEESGAGTPGLRHRSPTKCILNNNKLEERKREMELRRRKKEDEKAVTEQRLRTMQAKMKENENWAAGRKDHKGDDRAFCGAGHRSWPAVTTIQVRQELKTDHINLQTPNIQQFV